MKTIIIENSKIFLPLAVHFANICWILRATCNDESRQNLYQTVNVKDGIMVSTDRYRIHMYCQSDELPSEHIVPDGLWRLKSKNAKMIIFEKLEDLEFPDFWRLFGENFKTIGTYNSCINGDKNRLPMIFGEFMCGICMKTGHIYNFKYMQDAFIENGMFRVDIQGRMLIFGNDFQIAALMPMNPGGAWKYAEAA